MIESQETKRAMRAWAINAYGGPERLRLMEIPVPEPRSREVLIRMHGAEVGDWDMLVREGGWPMERPFPLVLGLAGAGRVAALGSKVTAFAANEPVFAYSYPLYDNGAWAEYMLVPATYVARAPRSLDLTRAGGVPVAGLTAHESLTAVLEVHQGDVVLITAAAGGVGHLAVQIATKLGGRVVATASRRNHAFVRALGAETVIDYTTEDFVSAIYDRYPAGVDKALNGVEGDTADQAVRALKAGGRMVDLTGSVSIARPDVRVDSQYIVRGDGNRLMQVARMIDDGRLTLEIQDVIPFEHAPDAITIVEGKHVRGKLVLEIAER
jgi:NADPH:quinone reductase-like Zn-dependent oxidoreductase